MGGWVGVRVDQEDEGEDAAGAVAHEQVEGLGAHSCAYDARADTGGTVDARVNELGELVVERRMEDALSGAVVVDVDQRARDLAELGLEPPGRAAA